MGCADAPIFLETEETDILAVGFFFFTEGVAPFMNTTHDADAICDAIGTESSRSDHPNTVIGATEPYLRNKLRARKSHMAMAALQTAPNADKPGVLHRAFRPVMGEQWTCDALNDLVKNAPR